MKRVFRLLALSAATLMLISTLCGCSAFVEGFIEGYTNAMNEGSGDDTTAVDEDYVFSFDDDDDSSSDDSGDDDYISNAEYAAWVFESNEGSYDNSDIVGKWIDYEDDAVIFYADGSVNFYDTEIPNYSFDGKFITLSSGSEELKYLARLYGETFVIYNDPFYYGRVEGTTGSLTGRWESSDDYDYSFEFFSDGTFTEDDYYAGEYFIEGNDILLLYDDGDISYGIFVVEGDKLGYAYGIPFERGN